MKKDPEEIIIRHNGKGNAEVVRVIHTTHGKIECMIAPNVDWKDGDKIVKALNNCHEELVEALKEAITWIDDDVSAFTDVIAKATK